MFRSVFHGLAVLSVLSTTACQPAPPEARAGSAARTENPYVAPPVVLAARPEAGSLVLTGTALPGAQVRLATPGGGEAFADVGANGRWTLKLPPAGEARVFGLSARLGQRTLQAPGYVFVAPDGRAALLRAGGGAQRLDPAPGARIGSFDFDVEGGAVVAGQVRPGAAVSLRLNGRQTAEVRADASGRFEIALPSPAPVGAHRLQVLGDGFETQAVVEVSPADPLIGTPLRVRPASQGALRADWLTPGGGVQSTILLG